MGVTNYSRGKYKKWNSIIKGKRKLVGWLLNWFRLKLVN